MTFQTICQQNRDVSPNEISALMGRLKMFIWWARSPGC
jgi:hypothetical protein